MEEDQAVAETIYQGQYTFLDNYGTLIGLIISIIIAVIFYKKAKFDYHTKLSISICLFILIFTTTSNILPSISGITVFTLPFIGFGMYLDLRQKENEKK